MFLKLERLGTRAVFAPLFGKLDLIFEEDRRINKGMKKIIALSAVLVIGALGMACGDTATNNTAANANKAVANAMNTAANAMANVANQVQTAANTATTAANTAANAMKPATNAAPANNAAKPANK